MPAAPLDRRAFLRLARQALVAGSALAVSRALTACTGSPAAAPAAGQKVASLGALTSEPQAFQVGGRTLYAYRDGEAPVVLDARCTHQGCTVGWEGGAFVCPCHGGRYDRAGAVLSGPPPAPLDRPAVRVEGDAVVLG